MKLPFFALFQLLLTDSERKVRGFENVTKSLSEEVDRLRAENEKLKRKKFKPVKPYRRAA